MSNDRAEHESADVETRFDPRHPPMFQRGYDPEVDGAAGVPDTSSRLWRARRPSTPVFPSHDPAARQPQPSGQQSEQLRGQSSGQSSGQSDLRFRRPGTTDAVPSHVIQDAPEYSGEVVQRGAAQEHQTEAWDPDQPTHQQRNPFIIALWIVGVGLIVGGIAFQWWAASLSNNSYSGNEVPVEVILQQFAWTCSPAIITVGGLTLVILIFMRAVGWQPRVSATDIPDTEPTA